MAVRVCVTERVVFLISGVLCLWTGASVWILWKTTDFQISGSAGVCPDPTLHNVLYPFTRLPVGSSEKLLLVSLDIV